MKKCFPTVNTWAVSVLRYSAGILEWSDQELHEIDIKTRKVLAMFGVFHIRSSVARLYIKRKQGGRGLMSVKDCVRAEEISLKEYVVGSEEWMLKVVASNVEVDETKAEYVERVDRERMEEVVEKRMHGKFFRDITEVADERTWQWLRAGYMAKRAGTTYKTVQESDRE